MEQKTTERIFNKDKYQKIKNVILSLTEIARDTKLVSGHEIVSFLDKRIINCGLPRNCGLTTTLAVMAEENNDFVVIGFENTKQSVYNYGFIKNQTTQNRLFNITETKQALEYIENNNKSIKAIFIDISCFKSFNKLAEAILKNNLDTECVVIRF